jgi:DNA-binding response OmpR family regulator
MKRILIIEDDQAIALALRDGLQYKGYQTVVARDGATGLRLAREKDFDLLILDVMLPRLSGLDVCRQLREAGSQVPIIMLTARGQEIDKVMGLNTGADDYLTKPFGFMELIARMDAVLRRAARPLQTPDDLAVFQFGDIAVNLKTMSARRHGHDLDLSQREFRILKYFIEHRGEIVSREQLLNAVWGYDSMPFTRTVDIHIAKLRRKIEDHPETPAWLVTVHGAGYRFLG